MGKKVRCIDNSNVEQTLQVGKVYEVEREYKLNTHDFYDLKECKSNGCWKSRFEDVIEPEPKKEETIIKKVRCIDSEYSPFNFGEIYEVERELEDFYYFKEIDTGLGGWWKTRFVDAVEEPKPEIKYPIIEEFEGYTVVFNPPYTIVKRRDICFRKNYEGKAKCCELDTYDKWEGFKVAFGKMKEVKGLKK